ncbi:MAG: hypothetical protein AAFX05_11375, partial [Planctomycetota bacterium]
SPAWSCPSSAEWDDALGDDDSLQPGESHEGHDHGPGEHDDHDQEHDGHDHGEERSLGTINVMGTALEVSISGDVEPGAEIHVDLEHNSGPAPVAIRLWIGDEAGTGALKSKADGHGDHFHGHAEAPSEISNASLWIEIEAADGTRASGSLSFD